MPQTCNPPHARAWRTAAMALAAVAVALACTAALPQRAFAYSTNPTGAIGKVTGKKHGNTYYGTSVADVMHAVDDMISTTRNPAHEDEVTIDLLADWNTKSYGRIKVPNGYTFRINLHGHMINRDRARKLKSDDEWYADGSGEVIYVDRGTLYLDGGTGEEAQIAHGGTVDETDGPETSFPIDFWQYDETGKDVIKGGLITGGACDDWHGSGGISLAGSYARAYIKNVTIAGNVTDQVDNSRYGHGAGIAVHGSHDTLSLDNVTVKMNHAEGYGGGIYVRETDCSLSISNSDISNNYADSSGGAIYLDSKASLSISKTTISKNYSDKHGGGIYVNASGSKLSLSEVDVTTNQSKKNGGGIYTDGSDTIIELNESHIMSNQTASIPSSGAGMYINGNKSKVTLTASSMYYNHLFSSDDFLSWWTPSRGAAIYINGNDVELTLKEKSSIWKNTITGTGGQGAAIYHNGKNGTVTLTDSRISGNSTNDSYNEGKGMGGAIYSNWSGTTFKLVNSTIRENAAEQGGAFYFNNTSTLILDASTVKDNTAGDAKGKGLGGAIYNDDSGTKISLINGSKIDSNHANNSSGNVANGGGIYSSNHTMTISSDDGTGVISYNSANDNGGGIYTEGELYLDNVSLVNNNVNTGNGGGIYYDTSSYKNFEVARTVKITDNKSGKKVSNLYLSAKQEICSAEGDRALTADSRIGVTKSGGTGRIVGNQVVLRKLGDAFRTVFSSDDETYQVSSADNNYVYLTKPENSTTGNDADAQASAVIDTEDADAVGIDLEDETRAVEDGEAVEDETAGDAADGAADEATSEDEAGLSNEVTQPAALAAALSSNDDEAEDGIDPQANECTITFDTNGGETEYYSMTVPAGTVIAASDLPKAVRENYRFRGWNNGDTQVTEDLTVNENMTLTARWVGKTVFVWMHNVEDKYSFDESDTQGKDIYTLLHYGDKLTADDLWIKVDQQYPVRTGYTFAGWYTDEACTTPLTFGWTLTEDADVYAKWEANPCTVTFESNGGSAVDAQSVNYDEAATEPEAPTKKGYVFGGWYTDEALTEPYTFDEDVQGDKTLYAKWNEAVTVTFDAAGGETTDPASVTIARGTAIGNLPSTRRGRATGDSTASDKDAYTFLGWFTADGKQVNAETVFDADTTIYAHWSTNDSGNVPDDDDDTPGKKDDQSKTNNDALPKTGDNALIAIAAVAVVGVALAGIGIVSKRHIR